MDNDISFMREVVQMAADIKYMKERVDSISAALPAFAAKKDVDELEKRVRSLEEARWKVYGYCAAAGGAGSVIGKFATNAAAAAPATLGALWHATLALFV